MPAVIALIGSFLVGLGLRLLGKHEFFAWILSSCIMPGFVLFAEFVLPYKGGGASMWPIALVVGSFYGAMAGGMGVLIASFYIKKKRPKHNKPVHTDAKRRASE